jgi:hypothetical protein
MRYQDFKLVESQSVFEAEKEQISSTLDKIENIAEKNPKALAMASSAMDKLLNYIKNIKNKVSVPAQQKEATAATIQTDLESKITQIENDIAEICKAMGSSCNQYIANMQKFLVDLYEQLEQLVKASRDEGAEEEFLSDQQFAADFDQAIKRLSAKTTGTLEALEAHYKQQSKEGNTDVEIKTAPNQTQVEKAVEDTLRSVFAGPAYNAETRKEKLQTRKLLKDFLNDCVKGIIPLGPLLDQGSGNFIREFENTKYSILKKEFEELLGKVPSGSGAGSWGPAELALSVVGTPVNKAEKGDLNIGGDRKIELKASRKAKSGGRVNTPAIGTGTSGKGEYDKAFNPFAKLLNIKVVGSAVEYTAQTQKGPVRKRLKYTTVGPSLINNVLNPAIKKSNISRDIVVQFVEDVAVAPVLADYKDQARSTFNADKVVMPDGTINEKGFIAEYLNMAMGFYAETDGVEEILVINPVTGNYHVIDARKMDTLHNKIAKGDIQLSTTYLDFTDNQSKASPQIGTE